MDKVYRGTRKETVDKVLAPFVLSENTLKRVKDIFENELKFGLSKNPTQKSSLQMENTFISKLCTGKEKGKYLALDLGGTNFRVMVVELDDKGIHDTIKYYDVPENLFTAVADKLFDFLADCIYDFLKENGLLHEKLSLGFCFSFPMVQKAVNVGILVTWTKTFNCPNGVGRNAVEMLTSAIKRRGDIDVDVCVVLNDTTGTLLNGAYLRGDCKIGLILGTGSNACYIEKTKHIEKWENDYSGIDEVVIDIEWGAFGDNGVLDFVRNEYDVQVDKVSLLPHSFIFEKMFAGKCLGEVVRLVLIKLTNLNALFDGKLSDQIKVPYCFTTTDVSQLLGERDNVTKTKEVFAALGYKISNEDAYIIKHVCHVISARGASLVSVCLANLLDRMNNDFTSIAINGTLYKSHPLFDKFLRDYISKSTEKKFDLFLVEDGSGIGAGLAAAIVKNM